MSGLYDAMASVDWGKPSNFRDGISYLRSGSPARNQLALDAGIPPPIHQTWWAKLEPGGFVVPHIDAGPWRARWHIPVQPAGFVWINGRYFEPIGRFPIKHWLPHAVWNPTDKTRIHLMIDRDVTPDDVPEYTSLVLTDMIPEIQDLIDQM